jgi:hypothetical protein
MDPDPAFPKKFDSFNYGIENEQFFSREKKKVRGKKININPQLDLHE